MRAFSGTQERYLEIMFWHRRNAWALGYEWDGTRAELHGEVMGCAVRWNFCHDRGNKRLVGPGKPGSGAR